MLYDKELEVSTWWDFPRGHGSRGNPIRIAASYGAKLLKIEMGIKSTGMGEMGILFLKKFPHPLIRIKFTIIY